MEFKTGDQKMLNNTNSHDGTDDDPRPYCGPVRPDGPERQRQMAGRDAGRQEVVLGGAHGRRIIAGG